VDGDLRKGALHNQFGVRAEPGLTEVLASGADYKETIRGTPFPNLWLLPRGALTHHSSELFVGVPTERFLKSVAADFDYVLVDTAPVMAADDVTSLAPHLDATIFVVRAEHTSARIAHAALDLLYQRRVNIMGLVFNAVRPNTADYYYYKYHEYYSTHGDNKAG
jgi:polysaccharide biosynthesis transport protein